jgi:glyoxylase-like metal-dependent hydrolase (beta-lactamase superfamily II)
MPAESRQISRREALKAVAGGASFAALTAAAPGPAQAAAPMLGGLQPSVYRFKLGAFEVTNILDGTVRRTPHPSFGNNQPLQKLEELAAANGVPATTFEHYYVNTVVNTGRELVLFDTGNGRGRVPTTGKLVERLVVAGYKPEQIDLVVITHGHPDHISGLMDGDKPTFANARYIFGEVEFDFWRKGENVREARKANRERFMKMAVPLGEKATFLKDGGEPASGIRAMATFGHSPGHMSYHVESNGRRLLIWGDIANHYIFAVQHPDWHSSADDNGEAAAATRRRVFDMVSADRLAVIGYHMPFPALGFVERTGPTYRWVPASYQFNL